MRFAGEGSTEKIRWKRSDGEPPEKIRQRGFVGEGSPRRFVEEDLLRKVRWRRSDEEGLMEKMVAGKEGSLHNQPWL